MHLDRRTLLVTGAAGATVLTTSPADAVPRVGKVLANDLEVPWGVAFLPNGDALVSERISGRVHRVRKGGGRTRIGTVEGVRRNAGEGGLLGLAVAPTFTKDHWVYAYYTTASDNRIVRMRYRNGRLSRRQHVVLAGIPMSTIHNGGRLAFAPGGLLIATTGDAADRSEAQRKKSLAGKILRLTPDGDVPADNPFNSFVWSYGHRNPQGIAFDARGRLWAAELGQNVRDELNRIVRGGNYGWPTVEGGDGRGPFRDPLATWSTANCSPSGIAVARGRAWVGALRGESLWSVRLAGPNKGRKIRHLRNTLGRIRTVQRSPDGSLWITTSNRDGRGIPAPNDDRVIRIRV